MLYKKGISPVVATSLLLVVAVISVVGFQGWFNDFSSGVFVNVESQNNGKNSVGIEGIHGNKLYLNSKSNVSINSVKINDVDCNINSSVNGLDSFNVSGCLENASGTTSIVVVTNSGIYESYSYISDLSGSGSEVVQVPVLDCSSLLGGDWLFAAGNPTLGTSDFCVMKFEAKQNGSDAMSVPAGTPWINMQQSNERIACSNLGVGYKLVTDAEWVTLGRIAELDSTNWDSGVVYSGSMWRGHTDGAPGAALSVSDVNDYYDQTGQSGLSIQRRTLNISGNLIWDMGGNVWDRTNDTFGTNIESALGQTSESWFEWNVIGSSLDYLSSLNTSLTSTYGIGQVKADDGDAYPSGTIHSFHRGGFWNQGTIAGLFSLDLSDGPTSFGIAFGFRCSYSE